MITFSQQQIKQVNQAFETAIGLSNEQKEDITFKLQSCSMEEAYLIKLLYVTLPLSDIADYPFSLWKSYAEHTVFLMKQMPWNDQIDESLLIDNIFYPRINTESLSDVPKLFYQQIAPRIQGMDMKQAALEVNFWCAEQATYHATNLRTASAKTVYQTGFGRCGEESTFTVAALRSVGIPARQVYAPRWSHCDDNHAWVEVWCDGSWYFMGACEPEMVLNRGWFNNAASRAMLVHNRVFTNRLWHHQHVISDNGAVSEKNCLSRYAQAKSITISVYQQDQPVKDAVVLLQILNESSFITIAQIKTDPSGSVSVTLGLGDIHLLVVKENQIAEKTVNTEKQDHIVLHLEDFQLNSEWKTDYFYPPKDQLAVLPTVLPEQKQIQQQRLQQAAKQREQKTPDYQRHVLWSPYFELAKGNLEQVEQFINDTQTTDWQVQKAQMLSTLPEKDFRDMEAEVLLSHLRYAMTFQQQLPEDIFVNYLLCPRIEYEVLTDYMQTLPKYFTAQQLAHFYQEPKSIWEWIQEHLLECPQRDYAALTTSPEGCIKSGYTNVVSKRVLFVALCRSVGIPARIHPEQKQLQYYQNQRWNQLFDGQTGTLVLSCLEEAVYNQNWSLSRWEGSDWLLLDFSKQKWNNQTMELELLEGIYRITTTCRLPSGELRLKQRMILIDGDTTQQVALEFPNYQVEEMLENCEISDFYLQNEQSQMVSMQQQLQDKESVIIWAEPGAEPTEHVLNEMLESAQAIEVLDCQWYMVLRDSVEKDHATLQRVLQTIPNIQVYYDDFIENVQTLSRRMTIDHEKLPLILVTSQGLCSIYAVSGYQVGTIPLVLKMVTLKQQEGSMCE